jgi:hypothetical protein
MARVIGLSKDVRGKHEIGLIAYKQSIRLVIADVLEDGARSVSTGVVDDLKGLSPTDKDISRVEIKIEEVEADPEEKKQLRKEGQIRKKEEQLREERLNFLQCQDCSDK